MPVDFGGGGGSDMRGRRQTPSGFGQTAGAIRRRLRRQVIGRFVRVPVRRQKPVPLGRRQ